MDRFEAMRLFTRIVELGSFSRAAEQLGLGRASATQVIKQLEQRLDLYGSIGAGLAVAAARRYG
ncbi:MAG: hypothetical protein PWP40_2191 [Rhodocyclaceae bacterium]|nr:hypothetical protein [Rhodocyclaceae bacterium]